MNSRERKIETALEANIRRCDENIERARIFQAVMKGEGIKARKKEQLTRYMPLASPVTTRISSNIKSLSSARNSFAAANVTAIFEEFNHKYFRGRLPRYQVISRNLPWWTWGTCDRKRRRITLHAGLHARILIQVLLHEMCHIRPRTMGHGPTFRDELWRVVGQYDPEGKGEEQWAVSALLGEHTDYEGFSIPQRTLRTPFRRIVATDLDMLALFHPYARWKTARRFLIDRYQLVPHSRATSTLLAWACTMWTALAREANKIHRSNQRIYAAARRASIQGESLQRDESPEP